MTKQIPLRGKRGEGKFALVNDADYPELSKYTWYYRPGTNTGYAIRAVYVPRTQGYTWEFMHRFLTPVPPNYEVDHINGDGLDNRRKNLRAVTRSQNNQNSQPRTIKTSQYKGVFIHRPSGFWVAEIAKDGTKKRIGYFETEREAAIAYNENARLWFGEYARLNTIPDSPGSDCVPIRQKHTSKSRFVGVYWDARRSLWTAEVKYKGKKHHVGRFSSEEEAAKERDRVALAVQGKHARLNFP